MNQPTQNDLLTVQAEQRFERWADAAAVSITVRGTSAFTGREVLKRATEVRELVEILRGAGFDEENFRIDGIQAQVSSFLKSKSSSARYDISVLCDDIERLPAVLLAVAQSKTAQLNRVQWQFKNTAEEDARQLAACARQAGIKAKATADALGVRLLGVHKMQEVLRSGEVPEATPEPLLGMPAQRSASAAPDFGFELSHCDWAQVKLTVEYHISGFVSQRSPET